jgi:hypothetical protein
MILMYAPATELAQQEILVHVKVVGPIPNVKLKLDLLPVSMLPEMTLLFVQDMVLV